MSVSLTLHDRCDRCGVRAQQIVLLHSGRELTFCQHHFNQHEPALVEVAAAYSSDREDLEPPF